MGLQKNPLNEDEIVSIIDQFLSRDTDPEQKVLFAQRKVEFLEDFGSDIIRYINVLFKIFAKCKQF
jgi:pre-mRNA-processing factor 39